MLFNSVLHRSSSLSASRAIISHLSRDNFHLSRDVLILSHDTQKKKNTEGFKYSYCGDYRRNFERFPQKYYGMSRQIKRLKCLRPMFRSLRLISVITGNTLRSDSESLLEMTQRRSAVIVSLSVTLSLLSLFCTCHF